jgi:hypothetical protein
MRLVAIVLLCVVAAVIYGVIHDQVTRRIQPGPANCPGLLLDARSFGR